MTILFIFERFMTCTFSYCYFIVIVTKFRDLDKKKTPKET